MNERLSPALERSLLMMNIYGLRPSVPQIEELAIKEFIDISQVDGWHITYKGLEYLKTVSVTDNDGSVE